MKLCDMTLSIKVGQMFAFSALSSVLDESTKKMMTELNAGGIFLGTSCLKEPKQVHELTTEMQQLSMASGSGMPLFISADFVAGAGCKLQSGAIHFPKNRAIGAGGDEHLAYESGRVTAEESIAMGINFNYSPVVDINNNPLNPVIGTHSFGDDCDLVSRMGNAVIRGYQDHGLIGTAKHFPGHGDTDVDSHHDLPELSFNRERLENFELVPFKKAIEAGVDAVMVGHIAVLSIDPSLTPASLSYELTTNLLRKQLGFQGLIVTDGLSMKGITNQYTLEEACILSILAGSDILLATTDQYEQAASMYYAVIDAVQNGRITEERIDQSVDRIIRMKQKYRLTSASVEMTSFQPARLNSEGALEVNTRLAQKAITPLNGLKQGHIRDEKDWIIIRDQSVSLFAHTLLLSMPLLGQFIAESYDGIVDIISSLADQENIIVAMSHNKPMPPDFINELNSQLNRVNGIWVHFGSEYDVLAANNHCLLMYDRSPTLQIVAAEYLLHG